MFKTALLAACLLVAPIGAPGAAAAGTDARYLYSLSDFSGVVPLSDAKVHIDRATDEIYVLEGSRVRIFNPSGMEIYRFGESRDMGGVYGLGVESSGDIILLIRRFENGQSNEWALERCDYRGEPLERIEVSGLPASFASFQPNRMAFRNGRIFLASTSELQAVVLDASGRFERGYDLGARLDIDEPTTHEIFGFSVDDEDNLLLTIPVLFKVFVVPPTGEIRQFGTPGSAPGHFGIVDGIVRADSGEILVADRLRGVIMVFDRDFNFRTEFGGGDDAYGLRFPSSLALGNDGRVYVSQKWAERGVALFALGSEATGSADPASLSNNVEAASARLGR